MPSLTQTKRPFKSVEKTKHALLRRDDKESDICHGLDDPRDLARIANRRILKPLFKYRMLMMTKPLSAVVVGTGFIGPVHVEALLRAGIRVAGIVGSSPQKSRDAAQSLGLPRGYDSLDDVLADDSVDSVHLTTPNRFHFQQAADVIRAGRHVLCEKPLAMTSTESHELVQLAASSNVVAGVAYNIRFYPLAHEAAARVASDAFGDTLHVTGSYVQDWLLKPTDFNWRVMADEGGPLRAVADIGTHWLDLVQFITGQTVTEVCADLQTVYGTRKRPIGGAQTFTDQSDAPTEPIAIDTEDAGCILLKFSEGARGSLHVSQTTAGRKNCLRYEIAGENQAISFNSEQPNSLWIGHRDRPSESLLRDPGLMDPSAAKIASYPGGHNEGFSDTFKQLFRTFYAYIASGDFNAPRPFPTFEQGHQEILLCEAILESHRRQAWVDVASNQV